MRLLARRWLELTAIAFVVVFGVALSMALEGCYKGDPHWPGGDPTAPPGPGLPLPRTSDAGAER